MNEGGNNEHLKKWLERLHLESWNLELIVSGFSIILLANTFGPLEDFGEQLRLHRTSDPFSVAGVFYIFLSVVGKYGLLFMMVNLILHLVMRGLWIGAIGLGSVSGRIDYDQLRLSPFFREKLTRLVGKYEQYCINLDKICSVIFSLGFLTFFMMLSAAMVLLVVLFIFGVLNLTTDTTQHTEAVAFVGILMLIYLVLALIYLIDFVTLGAVKRNNSISFIYYPVYRFFGWITLASIYRPIYYNLLSNRYGRKIGLFLVPYVVIVVFLTSIYFEGQKYYFEKNSQWVALNNFYDDQRCEGKRIERASMPAKVVHKGYVPVFIRYRSEDDALLEKICGDDESAVETGMHTRLFSKSLGMSAFDSDGETKTALDCVTKLYRVEVNDSIYRQVDFHFTRNGNLREKGIETMLDTRNLKDGKNVLRIQRLRERFVNKKDTMVFSDYAFIPFWLE